MYLPRLCGDVRSTGRVAWRASSRIRATAEALPSRLGTRLRRSDRAFSPEALARSSEAIAAFDIEFPFYGHYCGPGFGDPKGCTPPVDEVDAVCCQHDHCYRERGGHDCQCELELIAAAHVAIAEELAHGNVSGAAAGEAIRNVFLIKPCVCGEICLLNGCLPIISPSPFLCPI
jgi:hypothetical protein